MPIINQCWATLQNCARHLQLRSNNLRSLPSRRQLLGPPQTHPTIMPQPHQPHQTIFVIVADATTRTAAEVAAAIAIHTQSPHPLQVMQCPRPVQYPAFHQRIINVANPTPTSGTTTTITAIHAGMMYPSGTPAQPATIASIITMKDVIAPTKRPTKRPDMSAANATCTKSSCLRTLCQNKPDREGRGQ